MITDPDEIAAQIVDAAVKLHMALEQGGETRACLP
jgi:hypothetical protein